jgi:hypothetical protein
MGQLLLADDGSAVAFLLCVRFIRKRNALRGQDEEMESIRQSRAQVEIADSI